MATAVCQLLKRMGGPHQKEKAVVVVRFVGLTPLASSIRKLLASICSQVRGRQGRGDKFLARVTNFVAKTCMV